MSKKSKEPVASLRPYAFNFGNSQILSQPPQGGNTRKRCRNCGSEYGIQFFLRITSECQHDSIVCRSCVTQHIASELSQKNTHIISCPSGACRFTLRENDIKRFATQPDIERFKRLALRTELSGIPDFRWCANPQCDSGQIHPEGESAPIMTCAACNQKSCVIHSRLISPKSPCPVCARSKSNGRAEIESEPFASSSTFTSDSFSDPLESFGSTPPSDEILALINSLEDSQISSQIEIPPETKECIVCAEELEIQHFARITPQCRHEITVCRSCVRRHITHELDDKGNFTILCPNGGCKGVMEEKDINRFARIVDYDRYQKLSVNSVVSQMPDFRWCANPKCESGQIHYEGDDAPIMTCIVCNQKSCVVHNLPISFGASCPECASIHAAKVREAEAEEERKKEEERRQKLREENEQSESFIKADSKQCPKCKAPIHKISGCNHMTCRAPNCRYEFCWVCLAQHKTCSH